MAWGAPGGPSCKLQLRAVEAGQRPLSILVTAGQGGDSPQFAAVLGGIRVPRLGPGRPSNRPDRVLADKASARAPTAPCCAAAASRPPFPRRTTRPPTAAPGAAGAADRRPSTRRPTGCGMRWSAGQPAQAAPGAGHWYDKLAVRYAATVRVAVINERYD